MNDSSDGDMKTTLGTPEFPESSDPRLIIQGSYGTFIISPNGTGVQLTNYTTSPWLVIPTRSVDQN